MKPGIQRLTRWLRYNIMYLGKPPWDTGESPPELLNFIRSHPPGRAIDLGCGTGTNLLTLGQAGWLVTGVDFAARAVNKARKKLEHAGIPGEVRSGDVSRYETVRGAYDFALDIGCYHGLAKGVRGAYRANLCRIIKPGGWYLLYAHWLQPGDEGSVGITQADFDALTELLALESREDSRDFRGRAACWMLFRNQNPPVEDWLE